MRHKIKKLRGRIKRLIDPVLAAALAAISVKLFIFWGAPAIPAPEPVVRGKTVERQVAVQAPFQAALYKTIAEKDLFRQERRKYAPPPKPKPAPPPPPPPPPKRPPPRLSLVGTFVMDGRVSAILEVNGQRSTYSAGARVEDFMIKDIKNESVILERDGEVLRVGTSPPGR